MFKKIKKWTKEHPVATKVIYTGLFIMVGVGSYIIINNSRKFNFNPVT